MSVRTSSETFSYPTSTHLKQLSTYIKPKSKGELFLKSLFDLTAATIGLLIISPFFLLVAALVYVTSPGPIFYKSLRVGRDRQTFYMYKFRSMRVNADQLREQLYAQENLQGQLFKMVNDPRLTPIGGFLRKYSLDEFPQLINVIRGEMSLIGPRPFIPEESNMFEPPYTVRFNVMPGMTGPWQVSGRSNISFEQMCELEMNYVNNWSFLLDMSILFRTIPSVILKKGAY